MSSNDEIPPVPIIGIKFGSFTTVLGTLNDKVLDVLYSDTSSRTIPSVISFNQGKNRLIGDSAQFANLKNIFNTIPYLNRLICCNSNSGGFTQHENKFLFCEIDDNKIKFDKRENNNSYYPELIIAGFIYRLSLIWKKNYNKRTNNFVISVPDYYNQIERLKLLDSFKISNLKCVSLLNESSSICLSYYFHHYKDITLSSNAQIVVFIDMGDTKTSVIICSFSRCSGEILYSKNQKYLGCRDFDIAILEYLKLNYTNELSEIEENPKNKMKLINAISKSRKILTVNNETMINCELKEKEISFNISREKFVEIAKQEIEFFKQLIHDSIIESKLNIKQISSIEMVGDAIRNPIFQSIIYQEFNMNISKTLLADECIARGCALYNVMLNPFYSTIQDFELVQYNQYDIILEIKNEKVSTEVTLLQKGNNFPVKKSFIFKKEDIHTDSKAFDINFYTEYENKRILISSFNISLPIDSNTDNYSLVCQFVVNTNCIPEIADLIINYEHLIPLKNSRCIINQTFQSNFNEEEINKLIIKEIEMEFNDWNCTTLINRKNDIESLLYIIRNNYNQEIKIDEYLNEIENINDIDILNEKYKDILTQFSNIERDISFTEIEKKIRYNLKLLEKKKNNINIEKYILYCSYYQELISMEDYMHINANDFSFDKLDKHKTELESI